MHPLVEILRYAQDDNAALRMTIVVWETFQLIFTRLTVGL